MALELLEKEREISYAVYTVKIFEEISVTFVDN
jgi:hypothetical protein